MAEDYDLDRIFGALSDPTRRAILRRVAGSELTVGEIAEPFELGFAAVSKHLKVLEAAGLIHRRKRGSFSHVRLNAEAMKSADEWIDFYAAFWSDRLAVLKRRMEADG